MQRITIAIAFVLIVSAGPWLWADNLLANGEFAQNINGWTGYGANFSIDWDSSDHADSPGSGSLLASNTQDGTGAFVAAYCINAINQGDDYKFSGRVKVPSAQSGSGNSYMFWYWYDGLSCSGTQSTQDSSQWVSSSDDWIEISTPLIEAPAGIVSAWLILASVKISPGPGTFQTYFDGLVFNGASLFSDGFEAGDPAMWSGSNP